MDLSSGASDVDFRRAIRLALEEDICDLVLLGVTAHERLGPDLPGAIACLTGPKGTPVVAYYKGLDDEDGLVRAFNDAGIPTYPSVRRAVDAAGTCVRWHRDTTFISRGVEDDAHR